MSLDGASEVPAWRKAWLRSAIEGPLPFVTDVLGATPYPWQADVMRVFPMRTRRVAVRAGHGVGKTTLEAWLALWGLSTHLPIKIPITSNSQDQLRDTIWPEIRKWHRRMPEPLQEQIQVDAERVILKASPESFAVARTASKEKPEALQGFHEDNLLFLIDEASGIDDIVFEVAQGALSTPDAMIFMVGNPTRRDGYFAETFRRNLPGWELFHVSSLSVPSAQGHVAEIVERFGIDSNQYRVRVLGEFPTQADETVIPLAWAEAAQKRDIAPVDSYRVVWGLDVARFGDDRCALAKRQGNVQLEKVQHWRNSDTMQTAGRVRREWDMTDDHAKPSEILVDVIGIGAGVVDRLRELGLPVRGVNVGEAASSNEQYMRLRDELWFEGRKWLENRDSKLCDDLDLIAELTAPTYTFSATGKIVVESKQDMKKRGMRSPDLADAWLLTFAGGLDRVEEHRIAQVDRYRRKRASQGGSWMTA